MGTLFWMFCSLITLSIATNLNRSYANDFNLTLPDSPYFVSSNIDILSNATIGIENGIEIIFQHNYTINVYGKINACYHPGKINTNIIGLYDNDTFINIHGVWGQLTSRIGMISVILNNSHSLATFCNTKFDNMHYSVSNKYIINNCQLTNLHYSSYDDTSIYISTLSNTYIDNIYYVNNREGFIYDQCIIKSFVAFSPYTEQLYASGLYNVSIRNSQIYGAGTRNQVCIKINRFPEPISLAIYNNTIDNCYYGIFIPFVTTHDSSGEYIVQYNTIRNNLRYGIYAEMQSFIINNHFISNEGEDIYLDALAEYTQIVNNSFINTKGNNVIYVYPGAGHRINITNNSFINASVDDCIYLGGKGQYIYISYNTFYNQSVNYILFSYCWSDTVDGCGYFHIHHNNFSSNKGRLIYYEEDYVIQRHLTLPNMNIDNNIFEHNTNNAELIYLHVSGDINITNNIFNNNQVIGSKKVSLYSYICQGICMHQYIMNNTIIDNQLYLLLSLNSANGVTMKNNIFSNNNNSLYCYGCNNTQIQRNYFTNNGGFYVLFFSKSTRINITNNTIFSNNGYNIMYFQQMISDILVEHNTFSSNVEKEDLIYINGNIFHINNNIFVNNTINGDCNNNLINVYSGNDINIINNSFFRNQILGHFGSALYTQYCNISCSQINFESNIIKDNSLKSSAINNSNSLLHVTNTNHLKIQFNKIYNNMDINNKYTNNILYLDNCSFDIIQFNEFYEENNINSFIYFDRNISSYTYLQYNNFYQYDNILDFIVLNESIDLISGDFNYFAGLTNIYDVSYKMNDICDAINDGLITFWPWYWKPINFTNNNGNYSDLPYKCSWNVNRCIYYKDGWCDGINITYNPTFEPTKEPTSSPTHTPSNTPTESPTFSPSRSPTNPTASPTFSPSKAPSNSPTGTPSNAPSRDPTESPTTIPTSSPSNSPSVSPTLTPSISPTLTPSMSPSIAPSNYPTTTPTGPVISNNNGLSPKIIAVIVVIPIVFVVVVGVMVFYRKKKTEKVRTLSLLAESDTMTIN